MSYVNQRQIVQLSINNEFIRCWNSIKEASESVNVGANAIQNCCVGRTKVTGGFRWVYKENYIEEIDQ
jgi:hypothetical protein